ncbi:MAG: TetR/AcrR family transcriptional regulator [Planctomycetota bacterium]
MSRTIDPAKHAEILNQAKTMFMRQGFARTSMDAIAAAASVSKPTLYRHFADKSDLFREVMHHVARYVQQQWPVFEGDETLDQRLDRFAVVLHGLLFQPSSLAFLRLVIHETERDAEIGETYRTLVDEPMLKSLQRALAGASDVSRHSQVWVAPVFVALVRDPWLLSALTTGQVPTPRKLAAVRRSAIQRIRALLEEDARR